MGKWIYMFLFYFITSHHMISIIGEIHGEWDKLYAFMHSLPSYYRNGYRYLFVEMFPSQGDISQYIRTYFNWNYPNTRKHPYERLYETALSIGFTIIGLGNPHPRPHGWENLVYRATRLNGIWLQVIRRYSGKRLVFCGRLHRKGLENTD